MDEAFMTGRERQTKRRRVKANPPSVTSSASSSCAFTFTSSAQHSCHPTPPLCSSAFPSLPSNYNATPHYNRHVHRRNIYSHLHNRSVHSFSAASLARSHRRDVFRKYQLVATVDVYDPLTTPAVANAQDTLYHRHSVSEIVGCDSVVFALTASGLCVAYSVGTMERLCGLNIAADEVIRSLFYNSAAKCLILVSVSAIDSYTTLRCRSTSIDAVRAKRPAYGQAIFTSESLAWPGFVEFDDVNKKVLTFDNTVKRYSIWHFSDYSFIYSLDDPTIDEVKISPGILMTLHGKGSAEMKISILDISNGQILRSLLHPLRLDSDFEILEQFNEKMLFKQRDYDLQVVDMKTKNAITLNNIQFPIPNAFIFLFEINQFLTVRSKHVCVWNLSGQMIRTFDNHKLFHANTNSLYVTQQQDLLLSYCRSPVRNGYYDAAVGAIHVSDIRTGELVAKITQNGWGGVEEDAYDSDDDQIVRVEAGDGLYQKVGVEDDDDNDAGVTNAPLHPATFQVVEVSDAEEKADLDSEVSDALMDTSEMSLLTPMKRRHNQTNYQHFTSSPLSLTALPQRTANRSVNDVSQEQHQHYHPAESDNGIHHIWAASPSHHHHHEQSPTSLVLTPASARYSPSTPSTAAQRNGRPQLSIRQTTTQVNSHAHRGLALSLQCKPLQQSPPPPLSAQYSKPMATTTTTTSTSSKHNGVPCDIEGIDKASVAWRVARRRALQKISTLYYHESRNELYVGNEMGHVHVWRP